MPETSVVFDRAAHYYDETRGFPPGEDGRVGAFIAEEAGLSKSTRMLEIGVGTGRIALPLAKYVGLLVGVDLSTLMMARLNEKRTDYPDGNIQLLQGDVMRLPLRSHSFDVALLVHILHLVAEPERAVNELTRVLRPDGKALQCWNDRNEGAFSPLWEAWERATSNESERQDTWKASKNLLTDMGWENVTDEHQYHFSQWMSADEMADRYRHRVWSSMWALSDSVWQKGVEAVEEALKSSYPHPEEKHEIPCSFHMRVYTPPR
jgi:ubiquinone/menaquinone biosynthesis C-methylase UbiE